MFIVKKDSQASPSRCNLITITLRGTSGMLYRRSHPHEATSRQRVNGTPVENSIIVPVCFKYFPSTIITLRNATINLKNRRYILTFLLHSTSTLRKRIGAIFHVAADRVACFPFWADRIIKIPSLYQSVLIISVVRHQIILPNLSSSFAFLRGLQTFSI